MPYKHEDHVSMETPHATPDDFWLDFRSVDYHLKRNSDLSSHQELCVGFITVEMHTSDTLDTVKID